MDKLQKVKKELSKLGLSGTVKADEFRKSIRLTGHVDSWDRKVAAGFAAANRGYKGVLNDITVEGIGEEKIYRFDPGDRVLEGRYFDAVIIGGGIIGCATARELARYNISIALLEKEEDLAMQTSSRNDGMIHPGFAAHPGTKKAHYNVLGNRMYTQWAEELGFELKRPGSLVLFPSKLEKYVIPLMKRRARQNGVDGDYRYISRKKVFEMEPNVTEDQQGAFFLPSAGIISPYKATIAMAENAVQNGAEVFLNCFVESFEMREGRIAAVRTGRGTVKCGAVINCAGNFADVIAGLADDRFFSLHGRKGTECILDRNTGLTQHSILSMPRLIQKNSKTKGGGVVPCIEGNILLGPTAEEQPWREDYSTDRNSFTELLQKLDLNKKLSGSSVITYFSGIRPASWEEDFIIEPSQRVENLVHGAAIQSPGVASAPAIAVDLAKMTVEILSKDKSVGERTDFEPVRKAAYHQIDSVEERREMVVKNPLYGNIICRCETISEQEIRDVLRGPLPVTSLDAIKRRIRAGAGRCHGGFCTPRIMEIISDELGIPMVEITRKGDSSPVLSGETK
ncbi:NAD(P)/FAD-dependent oxidoreductase [Spirochaeta isovalerica]|uniref:Glycerol-3-phosphate dehydrogenase n=1 Tax=Spirochaeta isovalerica TaxID=150 RepID=A0A841RAQ8_9SPIO|nr:NAD(P)/FAD-dependent oxidoreductase [Spirochaeta isovalerica]MBB6480441.1 glycerol-3-phosphate dehydrogenase [Spirochaeta isovalerica]